MATSAKVFTTQALASTSATTHQCQCFPIPHSSAPTATTFECFQHRKLIGVSSRRAYFAARLQVVLRGMRHSRHSAYNHVTRGIPRHNYPMTRRASLAFPQTSTLTSFRNEFSSSSKNFSLSDQEDKAGTHFRHFSESVNFLMTQRPPRKHPRQPSKSQLKRGFLLFETLFPAECEAQTHNDCASEGFRVSNHVTVRPKKAASESNTPGGKVWNGSPVESSDMMRLKIASNPHKRNQRPAQKDLNLGHWLESEDPVPMRMALSFPQLQRNRTLPAITDAGCRRKVQVALKQELFAGSLPFILGAAARELKQDPAF